MPTFTSYSDPSYPVAEIFPRAYPPLLRQLEKLPKRLNVAGELPSPDEYRYLCIVGSRAHTAYGRKVCEKLISDLKGYPVVIVSGLALGIDSIAHAAAIEAHLPTVAFPGSGLSPEVLYPASRRSLADRIVAAGGALVSPFGMSQAAAPWTFPTRNALMAGISHATLIIEAEEGSGTLITARHATEFNRELLVVPGSIFAASSRGSHSLIREGASLVSGVEGILSALDLPVSQSPISRENLSSASSSSSATPMTSPQQRLLDYLAEPASFDDIAYDLELSAAELGALIAALELEGAVVEAGGLIRRI